MASFIPVRALRTIPKWVIAVVVLAGVLALGWRRHQVLADLRRDLEAREVEEQAGRQRLAEAEARLIPMRAELGRRQARRSEVSARAANLAGQLAEADPVRRWSVPPANLPEWDPQSPYIWIPKSQLGEIPVPAFLGDGSLNVGVAAVLTLDPGALQALNTSLTRVLAEFRAAEAELAKPVEAHLPGIAGGDGIRVTVRVETPVEVGQRHREQFHEALVRHLGLQRAEIVMQSSEGWITEQFNTSGGEPREISVLRRPDGTYNLVVKTGGSWLSVGGTAVIEHYIPEHLRSHFAPVLEAAPPEP